MDGDDAPVNVSGTMDDGIISSAAGGSWSSGTYDAGPGASGSGGGDSGSGRCVLYTLCSTISVAQLCSQLFVTPSHTDTQIVLFAHTNSVSMYMPG